MRRIALLVVTILTTILGLILVWMLSEVLALFFASVALAAALRPLISQLKQRRISESIAILICYAGIVVILGSVAFFYSSLVGSEVTLILDGSPQWYEGLRAQLAGGVAWQQIVGNALPSSADLLAGLAALGIGALGYTLLGILSSLFSEAIFIVGVLSLAYYWLVDQSRFERRWLSLFPVPTPGRARSIWRAAEREIGTYVRAEVFIVIIVSCILTGAYTVLEIPFPTLLGLASGVAQLVPWLGGPLMVLIVSGIGLGTHDVPTAALVLVVGFGVELVLAYAIRPQLYRNVQKINPLLVVILLLVLGTLWGPLAVLFAPPVAALIQVVYQSVALDPQRLARMQSVPELERLADRAASLNDMMLADTESRPELRSIIGRVRTVVARAHTVVASKQLR